MLPYPYFRYPSTPARSNGKINVHRLQRLSSPQRLPQLFRTLSAQELLHAIVAQMRHGLSLPQSMEHLRPEAGGSVENEADLTVTELARAENRFAGSDVRHASRGVAGERVYWMRTWSSWAAAIVEIVLGKAWRLQRGDLWRGRRVNCRRKRRSIAR